MAFKAKKPGNSKQQKKKQKTQPFFLNEKFRFILGIFILLISAYLLIAFISFLFFGAADQSKLDLSWKELVFNSDVKVENKAGKTGAFLSEKLMNRGFGIASFLFIYLFVVSGFKILGRNLVKYRRTVIYTLLTVIWFSVFLGFVFPKTSASSFIYPGGQYGFVLGSWLSTLIGKIGLLLLLFISGLSILVVRFEKVYSAVKNIFKRREKIVAEEDSEEDSPAEEPLISDDSISKVIDEEDNIKAIFEPDVADEEPMEIQRAEEEEVHQEVKPAPEEKEEEGLELTVHHKKEEEVEANFTGEGMEDYDPTLELSRFKFPSLELLEEHSSGNAEVSNEELLANKNKIVETLRHYKIEIVKIRATIGPTITLYEIIPAPGIRIAKIKNLEDDIALSLAALGIRIIAPIPGRGTIGIEVPNRKPEVVSMRSILSSRKFQESTADLPIALGKTISNETYMFDLTKMPHILVAGATGQGKSVGINVIITSLLYKKHPSQIKFVFIDPKKVELNLYSVLEKHYLAKLPDEEEPVITDIQKVKNTLNSLNVEMDQRYDLLKKAHARNIKEYNKKFIGRRLNPEKGHRFLPYIIVVIDEFADLIMTAGKEIELPIARIAQLARAVGIHMIIATQRPSTNIITGVIKANFPARIAFKVASMIDSRTILDTPGANQLIGKGDMLIAQGSNMTRVQCAFIDTPEVENICTFISEQQGFPSAFLLPEYVSEDEVGPGEVDLNHRDELFNDAARVVVANQMGSTSMIQRKFSIGYNRAGRIMDQLEAAGVVGPSEGSKARQVLLQDEYSLEQLLNSFN
ncbi:DNA segregation ATPase FtsK/SpoIIIE, S-DNA-T family [Mariniphaga anaerophila]|uniref:DNA segregation ATPase FtsK/SpoIIIE, S-DNA-T family n=1 Tax=Mariniphaga anaerophila TaxID=1484053 RepID=A0A1M5E5U0_9BACT|nr:DNA translocase FtsK [Mariniphaga anaerophila]SHF74442.1 DNA segregation ATPase FtsK/SpoIIIE, S-DNA-T family [Mariniphaga anaerophila]